MDSSTELDPMAHMPSDLDDLGNLFEFGDIDLNNITDAGEYGNHMQQQHGTHPNTPFQDMSEAPPMQGTMAQDFGGHEQFGMSQNIERSHQPHYLRRHDNHAPTSNPYTTEAMYQSSLQQQIYHQHPQNYQLHPQQGFLPNQHVPPTPNSFEMHGESGRFMHGHPQMDPQQRAIMEQRYHLRKDDAIAFTPMVSPAGTPQYNMLPEFTTPGAYFSPLTSPMLHAQNQQHAHLQQQQQQGYLTNPSTAPSSNTNSPVDPNIDVDMLGDGMALPDSAGRQPRKSRRKIATPKSIRDGARSNQNATQKAQKRKTTTSSSITQHSSGESMSQRAVRSQPSSATLQTPAQFDSSEAESISPEPLSESVMGPPPRPGSSVNQSPGLTGQQRNASAPVLGAAATPKSLLTMRPNQQSINGQQSPSQNARQASMDTGGIDDLSLPEAATKQHSHRPSLSQINTQIALDPNDDDTPRLSARKTPKLGPLSTPASGRPGSAMDSPQVGSPMTVSTPSGILNKKDSKGGRGSKKRGSMSANSSKLVSPALVPRISPSIKPLLPEGSKSTVYFGHCRLKANASAAPLNSAQQAMMLASKSNYQNLVEGNRLPGVNYPDSLSTGLATKRTSHKVAEQGRRNRINEALKEMQSLIPKPSPTAKSPMKEAELEGECSPEAEAADSKESKEDTSVKSNNSKAATVELANEYIKMMQKESATQTADLMQLRRENEELKRKLVGHGSDSQSAVDSPSETAIDSASPPPAAATVKAH